MLVLLVVLLVPCALVSALVRCDDAFVHAPWPAIGRSTASRAAEASASAIGARRQDRTSPVVKVRFVHVGVMREGEKERDRDVAAPEKEKRERRQPKKKGNKISCVRENLDANSV